MSLGPQTCHGDGEVEREQDSMKGPVGSHVWNRIWIKDKAEAVSDLLSQ